MADTEPTREDREVAVLDQYGEGWRARAEHEARAIEAWIESGAWFPSAHIMDALALLARRVRQGMLAELERVKGECEDAKVRAKDARRLAIVELRELFLLAEDFDPVEIRRVYREADEDKRERLFLRVSMDVSAMHTALWKAMQEAKAEREALTSAQNAAVAKADTLAASLAATVMRNGDLVREEREAACQRVLALARLLERACGRAEEGMAHEAAMDIRHGRHRPPPYETDLDPICVTCRGSSFVALGVPCATCDGKGRAAPPSLPTPATATGCVGCGGDRTACRREMAPAAKPRVRPVTDPDLDAPDGAVIDGYERHGDQWWRVRSAVHRGAHAPTKAAQIAPAAAQEIRYTYFIGEFEATAAHIAPPGRGGRRNLDAARGTLLRLMQDLAEGEGEAISSGSAYVVKTGDFDSTDVLFRFWIGPSCGKSRPVSYYTERPFVPKKAGDP